MVDDGLARVLADLPDAVLVVDPEVRLRWANRAAERLFGWSAEAWIGVSGLDLVHPDDVELVLLSFASVQDKEVGTPIELRLRTASGWRLVEVVGAPAPGRADGSVVLCVRDLTERRRWEVAGDEVAKFRSLIHNAASITMLVTADLSVEAVSAAITRMLGHDPEHLQGRPLLALVDRADQPALLAAFAEAVSSGAGSGGGRSTAEVNLQRRSGGPAAPFELTIVNLLDEPTVQGFVVSGHDITRLREAQFELEDLASHDPLTGLANRASLERHLLQALEAEPAPGSALAVAFIDLDRFKPINDLLGHDAGDELLRQVALRLRATVRETDFVARFGGDEFVVVAPLAHDGADDLARRLENAVTAPFELEAGTAHVHASVGIAVAGGGDTPETVLSQADCRMYAVKRSRRGNPLEPVMELSERRRLAEQLTAALARGQLVVHYQPVRRLADRRLTGFEALIRWQHPERGLLLPDEFLGVAEDAGRERELGELVLRTACADLTFLDPGGHAGLTMSVNLSAGQLDLDFVDLVASVLAEAGLAPDRVCLEILERTILDRPAFGSSTPVTTTLEALSDVGVRLAIDDFGTGYSSLAHLLQFPVNVLKVDRSFVSGMVFDRRRRAIVGAVIDMARGMGATAVAEGVERPDQVDLLRQLGCPLGQGHLLGVPAPADAMVVEVGALRPRARRAN